MASVAAQKEMRRLFVKPNGDEVILTGDDHKHVAYSLRAKRGDSLVVCFDGTDYAAVITDITKDRTVAEIRGKAASTSEPSHEITLFFGALKGEKNDFVVQKCTELGVKRFVPFTSKFSAVTSESVKTERLGRIALEAAKQSGRGAVPVVEEPTNLSRVVERLSDYGAVIFPYENAQEGGFGFLSEHVGSVAIIVGGEGGFSREEAEKLIASGAKSVTLGERILRAETACVAVTSVAAYLLGEWTRK